MRRSLLSLVMTIGVIAALMAAPTLATADGDSFDYLDQVDELTPVTYSDAELETVQFPVIGADGIEVYVEVTKPIGATDLPVILESSVYHGTLHGRLGERVFPDPLDENGDRVGLVGYFAPRGYAVAMMDLRGTGRSGGCLDHLGQNDLEDIRRTIEALAAADWSNGRVGMTGHSYVGATQALAAASDAEGLVTIVPSAGLASMYDHQFQLGVPYLLQYAGPVFAYEQLAAERHLPGGDDFGNNVQYTGCGATQTATLAGTGQATGQYELWHAERDHRDGATDSDIAVFMIHGVHDNAARIPASEWFFGERFDRDNDKVWLTQHDHGSGGNTRCQAAKSYGHPNCRFDQYVAALHAWFDHHLAQTGVDTGPAVEVFLNDRDARVTDNSDPEFLGNVWTADSWSRPDRTDLFLDVAGNALSTSRPADGTRAFRLTNASAILNAGGEGPTMSMEVLEDTLMVGTPTLTLYASLTTSEVQHLVIELSRTDEFGGTEAIGYCAIQPSLRFGPETVAPIVPGEVMKLEPQCFTLGAELFAGDVLNLKVGSYSPHHVQASAEAQVTLYSGPSFPSRLTTPMTTDYDVATDVGLFADAE